MPIESDTESSIRNAAVAVLLTVAAGFVDTFGVLSLGGVFTANMTGNTVLMGVYAFVRQGSPALHAFTIALFVVGLIAGDVLVEAGAALRIRRRLSLPLAVEALLLVGLFVGTHFGEPVVGTGRLYALASLAAAAMGLQNTSLRIAGILTVYTTHLTGTITKFSEYTVAWAFSMRRRGDPSRGKHHAANAKGALLCAALWLGFACGSFAASWLAPDMSALGLLLPLAIVIGVTLVDCASPLSGVGVPT